MASDSFNSLLEDSFSDNDNYSFKLKDNDALENFIQKYDAELLQQALQQCLSSCPENLLDEKIFNESFPFAHHLLSEALQQIVDKISTNVDEDTMADVKRQLLVCHELLSLWEKSMECVSNLNNTSASNLKCILQNVLLTVTSIFEHCKASKQLYGTLFKDVSEELTNLFRKAKTILNLFLATLDGVIVFDTDAELETELLVKVIDSMGLFATITQELDLKTFVETSKTFGKLAITHHQFVKRTQITSVTLHLVQLTKDISSMLLFCQDSSDRIDERKIKVIGHSLKILDRLFATYCSNINNEILSPAIELLLKMHRCSPLCLQKSQIDDRLIELINVHISRGLEPFLNTVFKSSDFKQAFFEYGNQTNIDKLGYHLLTVSIMKKIISMPYEQNCKWILGAESIIDVALTNINNMATKSIGIPLYFYIIGSTELCASHVKYLLKVYNALINRNNSLEIIILGNLIGRLYSLLSEETKHTLITELDDLENPSWIPVARFLPSKTKLFLQNRLACVLNEIPSAFAELQRQPTVQNWNRIVTLMSLVGKLNYMGEKNIVDILSQIWNSVAHTIEIFEGRQLDILAEFMSKLFSATQPEKIQDDAFFSILEAVLTSFLCFSSHVKVIASHYLRNNVDSFGNCGTKTANALAEFNCRLLEDENPWVRQEALESFDYVAHMCPNEDLVTKMAAAVTRKVSLSDSLPAYLSGTTYYELQDFTDVQIYLQHVVKHSQNLCHICSNYEDFQRDEKLAKMETLFIESSDESPSLNDFDEHVNKVCDELSDILKKNGNIGAHVLRKLRLICAKIVDLTESK